MAAINLQSYLTYVNTLCDTITRRFLYYATLYTSNIKFNLKSDFSYVDTSCHSRLRKFLSYDTLLDADIKLLTKPHKPTTYLKYDVDVFIYCTS